MGSNCVAESIIPMGWTFDEGIRASCDAFSIAIPDGYRILDSQDDDSEDIDVTFSAVPKANEDNETSFRIAIRIAENLLKDAFEEHGIDELVIAMFRKALNDDENMLIPNSPEHWVAQGKNCSVLVTRIYSQFFGLFTRNSYLIRPISNDMSFRVEITMNEMNDDIAEEMHEPINALVSSIEITKPLESKLTTMLDKISTQKVTPQEFSETVNHLVKVVTLCKDTENTANQLEYLRNCDEPNGYDATRAVVMGMEDFLGRIFPMFVRTFDAIEFQRSLGCTEDKLTSYFEVAKAMLEPCVTICDAIDQQSAQFLSEHGPIALPDGFWEMVDSIDMQLPGTRSEMEMRIKAANEQFQAAIEEHINKAPNDNEESDGVDYPTLVMTLLSDDWFFFMDDEITWDGHHHAIAGAQLNGAKADKLLDFVNSCIPGFDDVNEVFQYFVTLLNEIEKDEGLIVPRAMIAPGVQKAIREGDLTGLTLANLAACGKAFCVQKVERGAYRVIFDSRLIKGIPSFLDLVARLVWDLRQCTNSMRDKPFEISFLQARNIDADQYLGNVATPVPGAQEYTMVVEVTKPPIITLPGEVDSPKSPVLHQDSHLDQAEQANKQKDSEATRAEYERRKEEQRKKEERAATATHIEKIKRTIVNYDEKLQSHEEKIKDAADAAYRAIVRDLDRPKRRETLYKRYTAELMRDLELTEFNRFIKAQEQEDIASEEIAPLLRDKHLMAEGPLLGEATSFIEGHTRYLEKIEEGRKGDKSSMFNNPYHGRILEHLIEVGGDLSPEEISKDLFETKGLYWNPPEESEDDPIDVGALLRYMQFPALEMSKALVDLDGNRLMTSESPLWDSYNKSQTIISYKRMETNEDRCGLWFLFPLDKVSQLHYRRMLMDESHGAQTEIERLEGEIKRKEGLLERPDNLDPLQAEGLKEDISDYREKIEKYQQLARKAATRERDYLEYRALFYVEDQATVIPRDVEVEKTAFLATRPVAKPRKPKPPQAKNTSSGSRPSTNSTVTATSNASADASSADSGCLIPAIAAVIGFVVGCMNGGPFMGILLAAFTTGSAVMTINALKS